ncbi:MAG: 4-(cytidine 5'-diphospho)-2-C-methyl-D-erythritol kinase, partial [Chitinophagaceae bacterium]|nr:4-(cytidine 5'-diphospho)-2-C-methyl-D-erythritol kinase [Chitinophagaceae bacterium]
ETVFYPLRMLKDALEINLAATDGQSNMRISGKVVDGDYTENLVWKAYQLLAKDFPEIIKPVNIHLLKSIPLGAGLGGGSSDAAFMLRLLNKFFDLNMADNTLTQYALQLGSDCPYFIYNTPQFAKGRGELLSPISLDLSTYSIQLVCSKTHVATAGAFAQISPKAASFDLRNLVSLPIAQWKDEVINDFELPIFARHPHLQSIKEAFYNKGALYASMSGSGSAIYGIFEKGKRADFVTDDEKEVFYFE